MSKTLMIQGTMSNAGKSLLVAGLCRILHQDGVRVAPFKSQNMALNSYITQEGLEMGRAQVMQAEAAGIEPSVLMNPVLLKPTNDTGSQVIVGGKVVGNMQARDYFAYKKSLLPKIKEAFDTLSASYDVILIEGAGSPAEINLKENDIVNMGIAKLVDAPVLLVGDIDRGGVFAQLLGTLMLLEEEEQERICGLLINKFRGDKTLLEPGIRLLEERCKKRVVGVVPYMKLALEDEDSLSDKLKQSTSGLIDIAVISFPHISNFTDFDVFEQFEEVSLRYVSDVKSLGRPDMIILPGSKNTIGDLRWMRQNGLEAVIKKRTADTVLFGICGGYQMLGEKITDPLGIEDGGELRGMELLNLVTALGSTKVCTQVHGVFGQIRGALAALSNRPLSGYEIHMGRSSLIGEADSLCSVTDRSDGSQKLDGSFSENVYGTYVHGIFDRGDLAWTIVDSLAKRKGISLCSDRQANYAAFKEEQYDRLAAGLRESLNMDDIYALLQMEPRKREV